MLFIFTSHTITIIGASPIRNSLKKPFQLNFRTLNQIITLPLQDLLLQFFLSYLSNHFWTITPIHSYIVEAPYFIVSFHASCYILIQELL